MKKDRITVWNENFRIWNNFSEDGFTWIVLGDTYEIKDELKAKGAKFSREFGWHFNEEMIEYKVYRIHMDDVSYIAEDFKRYFKDEYWKVVEEIRKNNTPKKPSFSQYIGNIGDKIEERVKLVREYHFENVYGISVFYTFENGMGDKIVWCTSPKNIKEDAEYILKATVKDHSEFRDEKQTKVTRGKIVEVK